ncbi:MAG TPA: adenylyltransferase/cytidyltransferase family protein [Flavobacteriales bacterium]|nr:adenylyltransferase/cytidyltransferase family protein [Flavobacteriales bacterium]
MESFTPTTKIYTPEQVLFYANTFRVKGWSVGFTNGCFDILHKGHISYLHQARSKCSMLIVGLNSDASVKSLNKGHNRPINKQDDRAYVLAALSAVTAVTIFEESTPLSLIEKIRPDFLFKGGDYDDSVTDKKNSKYIVGSDVVKSYGGKVITIPFVEGFSTTAILEKSI